MNMKLILRNKYAFCLQSFLYIRKSKTVTALDVVLCIGIIINAILLTPGFRLSRCVPAHPSGKRHQHPNQHLRYKINTISNIHFNESLVLCIYLQIFRLFAFEFKTGDALVIYCCWLINWYPVQTTYLKSEGAAVDVDLTK